MNGRAFWFVGGVLAWALAAHVAYAFLVASALSWRYPHRMFDVQQWPYSDAREWADDTARLVGAFLNENAAPQRTVLFAGSSLTYGLFVREPDIFSQRFADLRPGSRVLNVGIAAAAVSGVNDWIICVAERNGLTLDAVIVELPVVNTLGHLLGGASGLPPVSSCDGGAPDSGYFRLALTRPRGSGWLRLLVDRNRPFGDQSFTAAAVPAGYFASAADFARVRDAYAAQIAATLEHARQVARRVYAFPSPVFVAGLHDAAQDQRAVEDQFAATMAACHAVPGVGCIDPSAMYADRSSFYNFTHLNPSGHRRLADLLDHEIAVQ